MRNRYGQDDQREGEEDERPAAESGKYHAGMAEAADPGRDRQHALHREPHQPPDRLIEGERIGEDAEHRRGHHHEGDEGQRQGVPDDAERLHRLEMKRRERRRGDLCHEGRRERAHDDRGEAGDDARDAAVALASEEASVEVAGAGDKAGDGPERHLEARPEHAFGLARKRNQGGQRQVAHAERRPVDEDRAEHHQGHDQ